MMTSPPSPSRRRLDEQRQKQDAKIQAMQSELGQARADLRRAQRLHEALVAACDEHERAGLTGIPIATLRLLHRKETS